MTVTYTGEVATCRGLGCFLKLLRRWKGSIYKLVWLDLFLFLTMYYSLNFTYRFALNDHYKTIFASVVDYCNAYSNLIPLSFVLGFYVSIVMTRWWNQYTAIPFPDPIAVFVSATIHGQDERGRVMRRTIMRYVCLCVTMLFTMISPRVKKRFPSLDHFVEAGLLQDNEKEILADLNVKFPKYSKHWMPLVWASSIITRARREGRIRDDFAVKTILDELNKFRGQCGILMAFDTISVPLVYTQTVTLAVYSYFLTALMANQWVDEPIGNKRKYRFDLYFPVFATLEFFFYMGWLKVAESLINPFGDDDDDFEVNWMVDRNLQVSYLIVDEMHHEHPELVKDQYWDEVFPIELPYTLASEPFREEEPQSSTANITVKPKEAGIVQPPSSVRIDEMDNQGIMFTAKPSSASLRRGYSSNASMAGRMGPSFPASGMQSVKDLDKGSTEAISRVSSVTNVLRRLFSKDDSKTTENNQHDGILEMNQINSSEPSSIPKSTISKAGLTKITDQVIEEVEDEHQLTITSMKNKEEARPSAMSIFQLPPPSQPISVPNVQNRYDSGEHSQDVARSAPANFANEEDTVSIGTTNTEDSDDEFAKLKKSREEQRKSRLMLNIARSVSHNPGDGLSESDFLLMGSGPSGTIYTPNTAGDDVFNWRRSSARSSAGDKDKKPGDL